MSIERMSLVGLTGPAGMLDEVLVRCLSSGCFHPEAPPVSEHKGKHHQLYAENPYTQDLRTLTDAAHRAGITLGYADPDKLTLPQEEYSAFTRRIWEQVTELSEKRRSATERRMIHQQAMRQVEHLSGLGLSFDQLFAMKYIEVRLGRLPADSYAKLAYYEDKCFFFQTVDHNKEYYWGLYLVPTSYSEEIDEIFRSLFFERIQLPEYVRGTPEEALAMLRQDIAVEDETIAALDRENDAFLAEHTQTILMLYSRLKFLNDAFECRKYAGEMGDGFALTGFVPKKEEKRFLQLFAELEGVEADAKPVDSDPRLVPPVRLKNNRVIRPYEMFVTMYGLPAYNGIDPTPVVAILYTLLFGVMFGDLGQGLVISLVGWLMWKAKKMMLGRVLIRCGISSAIFGCVYGSVFGLEHLLDPMFHAVGFAEKPIEVMHPDTTNMVLITAIGIGVAIILLSMILNIALGIKQKDLGRWLLSHNGLAGLVFYGYVVAAASLMLVGGVNIITLPCILGFVFLPILLIFLKEPLLRLIERKGKLFEGGFGGFFVESFFEMFEVLLSYITNTMSFLRVGGFILSHAGMMAVVMTLMDMVGASASPVVMVIGNLFVMGLEGLIVGIQVLRLQFYEVFSRFYDGDGKPYEPLVPAYDAE